VGVSDVGLATYSPSSCLSSPTTVPVALLQPSLPNLQNRKKREATSVLKSV